MQNESPFINQFIQYNQLFLSNSWVTAEIDVNLCDQEPTARLTKRNGDWRFN